MCAGDNLIFRQVTAWAVRAVAALLALALLVFPGQIAYAVPLGTSGLSAQAAAVPSVKIAGVNVLGTSERALEPGMTYAAGSGTVEYTVENGVVLLTLDNATISARTSASISKWISVSAAAYPVVLNLVGDSEISLPQDVSNVGKWAIEVANSANVNVAGTGSLAVSGFKSDYGAFTMDTGSKLLIGSFGAPVVDVGGEELCDATSIEVVGGQVACGHVKAVTYHQTGGTVTVAAGSNGVFDDSVRASTLSLSGGKLDAVGQGGLKSATLTVTGGSLALSGAGIDAATMKVTGGNMAISDVAATDLAVRTSTSSKITASCASVPSGLFEFYGPKGFTYRIPSLGSTAATFVGNQSSVTSASLNKVSFNGKSRKVKTIGGYAFESKSAATLTSATFGKNVTTIESYACKGCKKLESVTCGTGVQTIGTRAFSGCKKLKSITIKSKKLTKASVKNSLKGSSVTSLSVPKKKVKAYKKYFTKSNCGKKVKVKAA